MQIQKEKIKNSILKSAEKEFLEYGFTKASLRSIAKRAHLTKGAIYVYFKNKDELFKELAMPAIKFLSYQIKNHITKEEMQSFETNTMGKIEGSIERTLQYCQSVLKEYNAFKLLFFCSGGSKLENFREEIKEEYVHSTRKSSLLLGELHPEFKADLSEIFIETLANFFIALNEELIRQKPNDQELQSFVEEITAFSQFGLEQMLIYKKGKK